MEMYNQNENIYEVTGYQLDLLAQAISSAIDAAETIHTTLAKTQDSGLQQIRDRVDDMALTWYTQKGDASKMSDKVAAMIQELNHIMNNSGGHE